jgi:hypothetical protein
MSTEKSSGFADCGEATTCESLAAAADATGMIAEKRRMTVEAATSLRITQD